MMRQAVWVILLNLVFAANGNPEEFSAFFAQHKKAIQDYMMVGYGGGWSDCDIIRHSSFTWSSIIIGVSFPLLEFLMG